MTKRPLPVWLAILIVLTACGASISKSEIPAEVILPAIDAAALREAETTLAGMGIPRRFAAPIAVDFTPANSGKTETDGLNWRWRLVVRAPGAESLNFGFRRFQLPEGGSLRIVAPSGASLGPYSGGTGSELWTPVLPGNAAEIEIRAPAKLAGEVDVQLSSINRGFRDPLVPDSGACNVDVICPVADGFRAQTRSVALIQISGAYVCSGVLVNSTGYARKPYVLTGAHCNLYAASAPSLVAYFGFENSVCRLPGSLASGAAGDGSRARFVTGATLRAIYTATDTALVELSSAPPITWGVFYAGWNIASGAPFSAALIHHPNADEKRISLDGGPISITQYAMQASPGDGTHLWVTGYETGTSEPGSDGGPLFDGDGRIVATLHGGTSACGVDGDDWYGRLAPAWLGGGSTDSSLKPWLDPANTGVSALDGVDGADPIARSYFPVMGR